jgi:large subunit ribosomal protein L12e
LTVQNRVAKVAVLPSAAALVIKALKEPQRDRKKVKHVKHDGNLSLDEVYDIARVMRVKSNARTFQGTILEVLGSCVSVGCKVEGQSPKEVQRKIRDGEQETPEK